MRLIIPSIISKHTLLDVNSLNSDRALYKVWHIAAKLSHETNLAITKLSLSLIHNTIGLGLPMFINATTRQQISIYSIGPPLLIFACLYPLHLEKWGVQKFFGARSARESCFVSPPKNPWRRPCAPPPSGYHAQNYMRVYGTVMPTLVALDQTVRILGKPPKTGHLRMAFRGQPSLKVIESHTLQSSTKCSVMQLEPRGSGRPNLLCSL